MLRTRSSENNCFSKDAHRTAPSTFCAHNSAFPFNKDVITGIAAAVSVFLLIAVISIISYGIIIRSMFVVSVILMSVVMNFVNIIICQKNNLNIKAKLCRSSI